MMNLADVDKTGAVQPGSRVTWRYKFGGNENQLDSYEKWLLPQLKPNNAGTVWNRTKARWGARWNARNSSCCFRRF